jgi:hypothetical protein
MSSMIEIQQGAGEGKIYVKTNLAHPPMTTALLPDLTFNHALRHQAFLVPRSFVDAGCVDQRMWRSRDVIPLPTSISPCWPTRRRGIMKTPTRRRG